MGEESFGRGKRGFALATALIVLALVTIVGTTTWRLAQLEERSSAAVFHRGLAFQAAEAALRWGEVIARREANLNPRNQHFPIINPSLPGGMVSGGDDDPGRCTQSPCRNGLCAQPDPDCPHRWTDPNFNGWRKIDSEIVRNLAVKGPSGNYLLVDPSRPETYPECIVEFLGDNFTCDPSIRADERQANVNCSRYRITARSRSPNGNVLVMLQSIYVTP